MREFGLYRVVRSGIPIQDRERLEDRTANQSIVQDRCGSVTQ